MATNIDMSQLLHGTELLKRGFAKMQEGGVIMDVVNAEQAHLAEDSGAVAVMALERVPSDIRADGGVARMSHPKMIMEIIDTTSIPVMAKSRIGHEGEARILESLGVDMIDESEVLTPADPFFHIPKKDYNVPFVCGCTNLGEAVRRIAEGAAMIRTKGEAGTGNVVSAIQHSRLVSNEINALCNSTADEANAAVDKIMEGFQKLKDVSEFDINPNITPFGTMEDLRKDVVDVFNEVKKQKRLPVVTFSAGGIATPADAALLMKHGMDGVFVGSGIFKSNNPKMTADAIVLATHHYQDAKIVAEASEMMGEPMPGLEIGNLETRYQDRGY
ncbi:MAG: pyridoxal 5'-phosphate synthase lyase subunit PdxS [Euryarchaeota archaeon]|jgi:pyridoxal 5'-phosphate synthase pdxS subunit|nr:pyridoxal 5'-phosphate synthase lyase subunit PdxS [Euryarchaeota archaeon]MBT4802702.1 pyridoxal 5'-phosphate synthase lyase subunit PdxS [Euryarchaeota archaeon]MBT5613792.1 pyridoxal 5'-phosphate synthase lyase subunit PdxS [Euryarchaeota archaeon]MBT6683630.1 pyridoxal 5'-phosphate synthase lyase subunit PdxS [Euryarchaeota archaeon]MBT6874526.1 pyridoxal 5'-phosphate synthase lyase subunit PdxS [Euryarchaeota archaeon]